MSNGIDASELKRTHKKDEEHEVVVSEPVSAGAVDKLVDLAFNPSRDKIREVTIIDRVQGRLFPMLDMIIAGRDYILEVAIYRQDATEYKKLFDKERPVCPNLLEELIFRTAQWQKSVGGKNLERATDIALAETEIKGVDEEDMRGRDAWRED